jgi:hypothetical protein
LAKHEYKKALGFLNRRVKLARSILGRTYSMHPLRNAFDGVPFGKNKHGILVATTEDHLHAYRLGIMLNLAEVTYGGLRPFLTMQQNGNEKYFHFQFQQKSSIQAIPNHAWKLKLKHVFPFQFFIVHP